MVDKTDDIVPDEPGVNKLETEMLFRVRSDFETAQEFMSDHHEAYKEAYRAYHSAEDYEDLRKSHKFSVPLMQELVDQFKAHIRDKFYFANRPVTIVGTEDTDKADAVAKHEMMRWQDYKDDIPNKMEQFLQDMALSPFAAASVDYCEEYRKQEMEVEVEIPHPELQTSWGSMLGQAPPTMVHTETRYIDVPTYLGPRVNRLDPVTVFFGPDKRNINDEFPIMVKTKQTREFFYSKPYFVNQDRLELQEPEEVPAHLDHDHKDDDDKQVKSDRIHEYIEWQGLIKRKDLYKYLDKEVPEDTDDHDYIWALCGVVDRRVIVRLTTIPTAPNRDANGPNIVIGTSQIGEDGMLGESMAAKTLPMHHASEKVMGMILSNMSQTVNAMHVINKRALVQRNTLTNAPGEIIWTNDDVRAVHKRVEPANVSADLYQLLAMLRQWAYDASGLQPNLLGKGDANAETFSEANIANQQASLRMRDYLKTIEDTFIKPIYQLRNDINVDFLDQEYVYGIIGEHVVDWRKIDPTQIRANVDFICEASTRENNRSVMVQQLLQMIQLAPGAIQVGQPVRVDRMIAKLGETGFNWPRDEIEEFLPMLKAEKQGVDVDKLMVQSALSQHQMAARGGMPPGEADGGTAPPPPPSENIPSPQQDEGVTKGTNRAQQPEKEL